jgi:predicted enzyme related to lactoylglutathione lyase
MTTATTGQFIWYDLLTANPDAAVAFYAHVIGWTPQPFENAYTMFAGSQGPLSGVAQLPEQAANMGRPSHWTGNVMVSNVDETAREAKKLGGHVYVEPSTYGPIGRLAVIGDPQGNTMNVFKPNDPQILHDKLKPGEIVWHELMTADHESAFAFYSKLFGWQKLRDHDMGPMGKYLIYGAGGIELGGMFTNPGEAPSSLWFYYIQVADLSVAIERAKGKGATLLVGPIEVPRGAHIAQLVDPQGAAFALHENAKG